MKIKTYVSLIAVSLLALSPFSVLAESTFDDVNDSYWAAEEIEYIADQGIINGYEDGTFHPQEDVSRAQAAKMLTEALDLEPVEEGGPQFGDVEQGAAMYPYIAAVAEAGIMTGSGDSFEPNDSLTRAEMAVVLSNAFSLEGSMEQMFSDVSSDFWAASSIENLGARRITSGRENGSFGPGEDTTRAQFSVFLSRAINEDFRVEEVHMPSSEVGSEEKVWHFRGVGLGDSKASMKEALGEQKTVLESRYGFDWYIYHTRYDEYVQFGIQNNEVVAAYSNQDTWQGAENIEMDDTKPDVIDAYGDPLSHIQKGGARFSIDTKAAGTYKEDGQYETFFYDKHRDYRITAVLVVDSEVEENFRKYYAEPDQSLKESFERLAFHLANAQRQRFSRGILTWDEQAASTARSHSVDMASNHFFSHENQDGQDPFDRMSENGIQYRNAAENIAYGQVSPIKAHQSWMNSDSGHREALLGEYGRLGVGVAFDEVRKQPYYTQNFYSPE
ncbi:S-layer homology domain-containing protein [Salibacterium halotolerans]|uniref:S-layer homology domain-containing protein n=1 Tax=Salibacterium halotolerans TaxID=1884432 RepID=A0A1I5WWJ9_9BACI|nr:S-layer homology domain-containing protein [Salibacterium halotolerans]SFQ24059.1 S-layer homology domain-containing protein [Salibacterium halotolerans]